MGRAAWRRQPCFALAAPAAAAPLAAICAFDAQPARMQIGTLDCSLSSSVGMVTGSQRNVNCIFYSDKTPDEDYAWVSMSV